MKRWQRWKDSFSIQEADNETNEQHKDRLYHYACQSFHGLIIKIFKFETFLLVWQHVLACLNELMKKRSYKNYQEAFKIIYHIFGSKFKLLN